MAEIDEIVEPLSGEEIVTDVCAQVAEFLRRDCNLRESDAYQGGYRGTIKVSLELFGMDTTPIEASVPVSFGKPKGVPDQVVEKELEIPVEQALNVVRERSDQPVPTLATDESGKPEIRPRRYVRRDHVVGS